MHMHLLAHLASQEVSSVPRRVVERHVSIALKNVPAMNVAVPHAGLYLREMVVYMHREASLEH